MFKKSCPIFFSKIKWPLEKIQDFLDVQYNMVFCREEGMLEYLKVAQDLETYGISYFEVIL